MLSNEYSGTLAGSLEQQLRERARSAVEWSQPLEFDLSEETDRHRLAESFDAGSVDVVRDEVELIANDTFELNHPSERGDDKKRADFVDSVRASGVAYGKWFLMPWSKELIRYPDRDEYRALRTFRNRNLVTSEEQDRLYDSTVAVFGLSVGSKVVEQLVASGIGGTVAIGDPDHVAPSNLNRLSGGLADVGMKKIHKAARDISVTDPYIRQIHFNDGINSESLHTLAEIEPDIIFDEVDDMATKAVLRDFATKHGVPLLMATDLGDRSIIDIERHDLGKVKPFGGRLKEEEFTRLLEGRCSEQELKKMMVKIVGIRHTTARILDSVMQIDKTLTGLPQLNASASAGGALSAIAAREIILERKADSGRYVYSPKKILKLAPQASFKVGAGTLWAFAKQAK